VSLASPFLLYIKDLLFALSEAHATMYDDDITISYSSDNMEGSVATSTQNFHALIDGCQLISFN